VKWLAEFNNRRVHRVAGKAESSSDKTYKHVRFCQLAKLVFEGDKICYLEEYAQAMDGPGVRWPGIGEEVSDENLAARIRQSPVVPKRVKCDLCSVDFPSKTQLFRHLKSTQPDGEGVCVSIQQQPEEEGTFAWICMSLGYTCSEGVEGEIARALVALAKDHSQPASSVDANGLTWAVTPNWSYSAVVNVASIKLSKILLGIIPVETLPSLLNDKFKHVGISIHTALIVDRPCVQERREFEKYEAFTPWSVLQGKEDEGVEEEMVDGTINEGWSKNGKHCRKPLSETAAFPYVDMEMAKRLRNGARLLKDCGRTDIGHFADVNNSHEMKIRVRTRTMEEPWHRFCRISVSMRQPRRGVVERIVRLLLGYAQSSLSEDELVSSALEVSSSQNCVERSSPLLPDCSCTQFICLLEPALTKYEGKIATKLCGDNNNNATKMPEVVKNSIERMEVAILAQRWQDTICRGQTHL